MNWGKCFFSGCVAGLCIALGGTVFLSSDSKILGAVLFTVGLFTICTFEFSLFTGKVCYLPEHDLTYAGELVPIWLGNLSGTWAAARLLVSTRYGTALAEKAVDLCTVKLMDDPLSLFILAIFCNILIYIAVENYNGNPQEVGRYLAMFLGVVVFIFCGFEHCVADMFYFSLADVWNDRTILCLLMVTFGNSVGGLLLPLARLLLNGKIRRLEAKQRK